MPKFDDGIDDHARFALAHRLADSLAAEKSRFEIDVDDFAPFGQRKLLDRMLMQSAAGKIDQQIDASGLSFNIGKDIFDLGAALRQLNRAIFGLASLLAQLFGLGSALLILVENENRIAGSGPNGLNYRRPMPPAPPLTTAILSAISSHRWCYSDSARFERRLATRLKSLLGDTVE